MNLGIQDYNFWDSFPFFTNNVITISGIPSRIDYSIPVYRARKHDGFDIKDISELRYPSKDKCKQLGRANIPYYPVFYCSYQKQCAIKELKLEETRDVVISEWRWKYDITLEVKLFSKQDQDFENSLGKFNVGLVDDYIKMLERKWGKEYSQSMIGDMLNRMHSVCDLFLNDKDYFGSAIVAYEELYRTRLSTLKNTDILVYPSLEYNGGVNVAIHPDVVDKYLDVHSVEMLEVAENGKFQIKSSHRLQP